MGDAPGVTITGLVDAAEAAGYTITVRTVREWTARGLLDRPTRRALGRGNGSAPARYDRNQQELLLTLLHHRPGNDIASLARIPVAMWLFFGDDYVNLAHARRAFVTWLGDPRVSLEQAQASARRLVAWVDTPSAIATARRHLLTTVADIAYTGRADTSELTEAVHAVFEPDSSLLSKAVGHPAAPLTTDAVVGLVEARLLAARVIADEGFTDAEFLRARDDVRRSRNEYAAQHAELARVEPALYEPPTWDLAIGESCTNLLTILGLNRLHRHPRQPTPREPPDP